MAKKTEGEMERASLREYAEKFFSQHGQDVFAGLGIAIGLSHWLALGQIYIDLARPWGKKGKERLGTPSGEGWVSVDDMANLFGIQRARVTLQTALRINKVLKDYLTREKGDYKAHFPALATELYETAQTNFAKATVTVNALYKAAKADPRFRDALAFKAPDWGSRATALLNTLVRRLNNAGLDAKALHERHEPKVEGDKRGLTIADAAFLFLGKGHLESLAFAVEEAIERMPKVASFEARVAVANDLLDVAIAMADTQAESPEDSLLDQMEEAIERVETGMQGETAPLNVQTLSEAQGEGAQI